MRKGHGHRDYFIMGQGMVSASLGAVGEVEATQPTPALSEDAAVPPQLKFGKMFPDLKPAFEPADDKGLIELGQAMINSPDLGDHPTLPAGYTYLAQFIAHDVSFDQMQDIPAEPV